MKKQLYGIDLDGVCFQFVPAFSEWLKDKCNISFDNEEITSYYWYNCVAGLDEEVFWDEFHKFGKDGHGYKNLELVPGTIDALNRIISHGNKIVYITNRPGYAAEDTMFALKNANLPCAEILFAGGEKSPIVNSLGVDVFVDDSPRTIAELTQNTQCRVYCMDHTYNRHLKDEHFIRVFSWKDFIDAEGL